MKKYQNGFTVVEALLITVIVGMLGGVGWYVWHSQAQVDKTYLQTSNGSVVLPKKSTPPKPVSNPPAAVPQQNYLTIKEWKVKFPLSSTINDAYYTPNSSNENFSLRVHSLDSESACKNSENSVAGIIRITLADYNNSKNNSGTEYIPSTGATIGNYYYYIRQAQYACNQDQSRDKFLPTVLKAFTDASSQIQAE